MDLKKLVEDTLLHYNLTATGLARAAGVSQPTVCKILTGNQKTVRSDTYEKLSPYFSRTAVVDK